MTCMTEGKLGSLLELRAVQLNLDRVLDRVC